MKLFPSKNLSVELRDHHSMAIERLERETDLTDSLASTWTDKEFRGQISPNGFKLISSEIGYGALCVLIGKFQGTTGEIEIRLHKAFKIMFSILLLLPLVGFGIAVYTVGRANSYGLIIPIIMGILFIRFAFMELAFRYSSKIGLKKLNKIMRILKITRKSGKR